MNENDTDRDRYEEIDQISFVDMSKIEHYEELLAGFCLIAEKYRLCEESR